MNFTGQINQLNLGCGQSMFQKPVPIQIMIYIMLFSKIENNEMMGSGNNSKPWDMVNHGVKFCNRSKTLKNSGTR